MNSEFGEFFYIGDIKVDLNRSVIVRQDNEISVEPKILQVLALLSQNKGRVVSYKEIRGVVWPNVEVGSNTLHRSIAQLRKALGDSAQRQAIIETHPKIGYSLNKDVGQPTSFTKPRKSILFTIVSLFAAFSVLSGMLSISKRQIPLPLSSLSSVSIGAQKESAPVFSSSGDQLIFKRYTNRCKSHLWLKDLSSHEEHRLTESPGFYSHVSWSPDNQRIVYVSANSCDHEGLVNYCQQLQTTSIPMARAGFVKANTLINCHGGFINGTVWTNDNLFYLIDRADGIDRLLALQFENANKEKYQLNIVHESKDTQYFDIEYSESNESIIIANANFSSSITFLALSLDGAVKWQRQFNYRMTTENGDLLSFHWNDKRNRMYALNGKKLIEFDLSGDIQEHTIPSLNSFHEFNMSPNGDSFLASTFFLKKDLFRINKSSLSSDRRFPSQFEANPLEKFNSRFQEEEVKLRPSGAGVAFVSNRNMHRQLFLSVDNSPPKAIAKFIGRQGFTWHASGNSLIIALNGKLFIVDIAGTKLEITLPFEVTKIFQSVVPDILLVEISKDNSKKIVELNLNSKSINLLYEGEVRWAQRGIDGETYVSDMDMNILKITNNQPHLIPMESWQLSKGKFFIENDKLYYQNKNDDILCLNLDTYQIDTELFAENNKFDLEDVVDGGSSFILSKKGFSLKSIVLFHNQILNHSKSQAL